MDNTVIKIYQVWEIIYFFKKKAFRMHFKISFQTKSARSCFKIIIILDVFFLLSLFTIANFSKILRVKEDKNFQLLLTLYVEHANDSI